MKKLISIIFLFICVLGYSQNVLDSTRISGTWVKAIKGPTWGYFWGGTADTLNASDTLTKIIRVMGDGYMSGEFSLNITKNSGTVTNKFIIYKSIEYPYEWIKVDSIVNTNVSSGSVLKTLSNFNGAFMKWEGISPATAQDGNYKMFFIMRY